MVTRQMTPFFHLPFPIQLFLIFISEFDNTENSFSCGAPFGPFWSIKYLNFWPKATDSDSSSHFSRKQRLLKIYIKFFPPANPNSHSFILKIYIKFFPPAGAKYPFFRLQLMDQLQQPLKRKNNNRKSQKTAKLQL